MAAGAEIAGANGRSGWDRWIVSETADKTIGYAFAESFFRHMAFPRKEQGVELAAFDVEKHVPQLEWVHNNIGCDQSGPDWIRERTGRVPMYVGSPDQSLNAQMGVDITRACYRRWGARTPAIHASGRVRAPKRTI